MITYTPSVFVNVKNRCTQMVKIWWWFFFKWQNLCIY